MVKIIFVVLVYFKKHQTKNKKVFPTDEQPTDKTYLKENKDVFLSVGSIMRH